jgi:signal peptidase I
MRTIGWIIATLISIVLAGLLFVYFSPDYHMSVVRSESMKPTINMGDMIITGPLGGPFGREIKPGAIMSYQTGKTLVTHRVLSFDGNMLVFKGDAVEDPDPQPVAMSQVKGLYLFKIPALGFASAFIHTKLGWFLVIILPAAILVAWIIKEIIKEALSNAPSEARRR